MKTRRKILITILVAVLIYVVNVEIDNYLNGSLHQTSIHTTMSYGHQWILKIVFITIILVAISIGIFVTITRVIPFWKERTGKRDMRK